MTVSNEVNMEEFEAAKINIVGEEDKEKKTRNLDSVEPKIWNQKMEPKRLPKWKRQKKTKLNSTETMYAISTLQTDANLEKIAGRLIRKSVTNSKNLD